MIAVTSSNVLEMQDSAFADVLADLNQKHKQMQMSMTLLIASTVLAVLVLASIGSGAIGIFLLVPIAWAIGAWLDSFKRVAVLFYDVEDDTQQRFAAICAAFDELANCEGNGISRLEKPSMT
jgi:fatty acid desaturase